jgi:putative PIN family toxin of toxin-antitoxin system
MRVVRRVVVDTSTLVSAALRSGSVPDQALMKALRSCELCASEETLRELAVVMERRKFDRYMDRESRREFVALMRRTMRLFAVQREELEAVDPPCRDSGDNKFLVLALACEADIVVSSDDDLLTLHPWRGVAIVSPTEFIG